MLFCSSLTSKLASAMVLYKAHIDEHKKRLNQDKADRPDNSSVEGKQITSLSSRQTQSLLNSDTNIYANSSLEHKRSVVFPYGLYEHDNNPNTTPNAQHTPTTTTKKTNPQKT